MQKHFVGIMAYQGSGHLFARAFDSLNINYKFIRCISDLSDGLTVLIMPGGESSVQADYLKKYGFVDVIKSLKIKVFGVCAGMILLSSYKSKLFEGFGLLDVDLERNFYGAQIASGFYKSQNDDEICFIRAPAISKINDSKIEILDIYDNRPILIKKDNFYAASFHPEINNDGKYGLLHNFCYRQKRKK